MRAAMIGAAALMLAGCGHLPGHKAVPRGGETITYATGPCFGNCPVYSVTLGPDGQGIFTGVSGLGVVTGDHRFQTAPIAVRNYQRALAAVRPSGERLLVLGQRGCGRAATDQSSIDVRWQSADGSSSHLRVYEGCRGNAARALIEKLRGLPDAHLPLQEFRGSD